MPEYQRGDYIWRTTYPHAVGWVLSAGTIGRWPAYRVKTRTGQLDVIFADEAELIQPFTDAPSWVRRELADA